MNCKIRQRAQMPRPQLNKTREILREEAKKLVEAERSVAMRRNYKLIAYALNRRFGHGKGRISDLLMYIQDTITQESEQPDFWRHLDRVVIDEIGIDLDREEYE